MIEQTPWIERNFNFEFPVGYYPSILVRLMGTAARISEMTEGVPEQVLSLKPSEKWSAKEHIGHLIDLDILHITRLQEYIDQVEVLKPADMTNQQTFNARHNEKSVDELIVQFRDDRGQFLRKLMAVPDLLLASTVMHPRLKVPLRLVDMAYFVAEHDDHHLATMHNLINEKKDQ
jgi:hypothetical protein